MTRAIRFRVWDPIEKTMEYPNDDLEEGRATIRLDGRAIPGIWFYSAFEVDDYHHSHPGRGEFVPMVPMLSTGLTDKNGREIFEGDVVRNESGRACLVEWRSTPAILGFDLTPVNDVGFPPSRIIWSEWTIVGNVWESPTFSRPN